MELLKSLFVSILIIWSAFANSQTQWYNPINQSKDIIQGRGWGGEMAGDYNRLPSRMQNLVRPEVWNLSLQSAGLSIVFYTDAKSISVKYTVSEEEHLSHMPATGTIGVDLYVTTKAPKQYWCEGYFNFGDTITYEFQSINQINNELQEFELFLPLYSQMKVLEIGIPKTARLYFADRSQDNPIVIYGTSITQGACASRPGMSWSNILHRTLKVPVVNLGFSGNGELEPELFNLFSEIKAQLYIVDCLPNMIGDKTALIYERILAGVYSLREKSKAPILLVEHGGYMGQYSSENRKTEFLKANLELQKAYHSLLNEGFDNIFYLSYEEIGLSMDSQVDGIHPSDLGMLQYSLGYINKIREFMRFK